MFQIIVDSAANIPAELVKNFLQVLREYLPQNQR